jgi:hypothetical protein
VRCRVRDGEKYDDGLFLGLHITDEGDTLAVVRLDRHGMYVNLFHPSKVEMDWSPK